MTKTFLVTGSTSGIGFETARQLCGLGELVFGVGRSPERCQAAKARIRAEYPQAQIHYFTADLSLQAQVRDLASRVKEELSRRGLTWLDGLVNDAAMVPWRRLETQEGIEMQWAVNHLAPFRLTHELLPVLSAAPLARVVTVSSGSHYGVHLNWADLQLRQGYNFLRMYGQTKLANVYFTAELRRRLGPGSSIQAFAADPGLVRTELGGKDTPALVRLLWRLWSRRGITAEQSARGVVFLATEASIAASPDVYWKHGKPQPPNPAALDPAEGRRLWEISERLCGL